MLSRRSFIGLAGASLAELTAGSPAWAREACVQIDSAQVIAETFVFDEWAASMDRAVVERGNRGDRAFWQTFRTGAATSSSQQAVLTLPAPGVELFEAGAARDLAAFANDQLAAYVRSTSDCAGLATLSSRDPRAVREAERAIEVLRLAGLSLGVNRIGRLDDHHLWPVYEYAEARKIPIYLPAAYAPVAGNSPYRALGSPGILAGAASDSAAHARQLIFGGVLDAFPQLSVVLARLGEGTPYWYAEMTETYVARRAAGAPVPKHPAEHYFKTNIALTTADVQSIETMAFCAGLMGRRSLIAATQ